MARLQKNRMKRGVGGIMVGVVGEIAHPTSRDVRRCPKPGEVFA